MKTSVTETPFEGNESIKRTLWPVDKRHRFYPTFLPGCEMAFEQAVFRFMEEFCKPYNGGYWDFYILSNGGFYLCLNQKGDMRVENHENYFFSDMSADAASIGVNLFALGQMAHQFERQHINDAYYHLLDYAKIHPEADKILRFID
ncbi:antirestriction protein [Aquimarina aggregata]|uniref:antirestriction protein n=1 Tax=Aquimarina aggregata TaxID=1642818 RepID=UPI0024913874|nr:antirestriction protein [Aquimarina aggregata]